jgi:mycothiol synthase
MHTVIDYRITGRLAGGVHIRNYRDGDLPALVELVNETDAVEQLERATSLREWQAELEEPGFDPFRDLFVAETADGRLVGEAEVHTRGDDEGAQFFTWGCVHPGWRRRAIGRRLMGALWQRSLEKKAELGVDRADFRATCLDVELGRRALFERLGMQQERVFYNMLFAPLDGNLAEPQFPPGITIRSYVPGQDDVVWLAAANEAFRDHWNHTDRSLASWQHHVQSEGFKPDISLIAMDGDEIAGVCHNVISEEKNGRTGRKEGLVATLGVRRSWRKRGLGTALLLASLHVLHAAGMESAELGVDSHNLTGALALYERVGFRVRRRWLAYSKRIES